MRCEITVKGTLDVVWADVFNGMTLILTTEQDGHPLTMLTGEVHDQAALRGILNKLWDLNLTLVSVKCEDIEEESHDDKE